jgi:hypothetical protein
MNTARIAMLTRFLTEDLCLSPAELRALGSALTERVDRKSPASAPGEPKRTLYLPCDTLDDL